MGKLLFALGGWRRQLGNFELRFRDGRIFCFAAAHAKDRQAQLPFVNVRK